MDYHSDTLQEEYFRQYLQDRHYIEACKLREYEELVLTIAKEQEETNKNRNFISYGTVKYKFRTNTKTKERRIKSYASVANIQGDRRSNTRFTRTKRS